MIGTPDIIAGPPLASVANSIELLSTEQDIQLYREANRVVVGMPRQHVRTEEEEEVALAMERLLKDTATACMND